MSKKIIILNGSPRKNGNTSALTAAFAKGAAESGNQVTEFHLSNMKINCCIGCWQGGKNASHPCSQHDDMEKIYPLYREADVVVLASPLYYWNLSGQLRTAFDRLFALEEGDGNLLRGHGRSSALLMAAEGHGFEDVVTYYDHLMEHLRWENLGHVLSGGVMDVGDIKGRDELKAAYDLGKAIQ